MDYLSFDLGQQPAGAGVRVTLEGNAANVRLMDRSNFRSYQAGREHRCYGGHYNRSPVVLTVPNYDHWYVAVDYGGYAGRGRASVEVFNNEATA
jgi:hypothetical protein